VKDASLIVCVVLLGLFIGAVLYLEWMGRV
jgi:hypothetical protein